MHLRPLKQNIAKFCQNWLNQVHFRAVLADGVVLESSIPGSSWDLGIFPFPVELNVFEGRTVTVDRGALDVFTRCCLYLSTRKYSLKIGNSDRERFAHEFDVKNDWDYLVTTNCSSRVDGCDAIIWDPINADGTLNVSVVSDVLNIINARWKSEIFRPVRFLPDRFVCRCMLVQSSKLSKLSRPDSGAHCGVDLASSLEDYHLFEYREINLESFPLESLSADFNVIEIDIGSIVDLSPNTPVVFATNVIEVPATQSGLVDGMVYWW